MTESPTRNIAALVRQHHRASEVPPGDRRPCGGGVRQPTWPACHVRAVFVIKRPWGAESKHAYCPEHALLRLQADDQLATEAKYSRGGDPR